MKTAIALALVLISVQSASAATAVATATPAASPVTKNVRDTVDVSCAHEQGIAHCGNDVVGEVLFTCIDTYKKAHADFKISSACTLAIDKFHASKKTAK